MSVERVDALWLFRSRMLRVGGSVGAVLGGIFAPAYVPPIPVQAEVQNLIPPERSSESAAAQVEREVLYEADMSEWPVLEERCGYSYFDEESEEYYIGITCENIGAVFPIGGFFTDFDLTVDIRQDSGSNTSLYGIFMAAEGNFGSVVLHRFLINGMEESSYDVYIGLPGVSFIPSGESHQSIESPAIFGSGELNSLRLIRMGSDIEFQVNDEVIRTESTSIREDQVARIGIMIQTPVDISEEGETVMSISRFIVLEPE